MNDSFEPKIIRLETVKSTNDYLQEKINELIMYNKVIVIASVQTGGKGYSNNKWESEPGKNLTISYLFRPDFLMPEKQFLISKFISLGIIDFLELYLLDLHIKWPNDIYANDKKIAGILIENSIIGDELYYSVAGIGINVNQEIFSQNLINPISMKNITGFEYSLDDCLDILMTMIENRYNTLKEAPDIIDKDYLTYLYRYNIFHPFRFENKWFNGKITGLDSSGRLVIEKENGVVNIYGFKEVEYII